MPHTNQKYELDRQVALATGFPKEDVGVITGEFINQINLLLCKTGKASVGGLGRFRALVHRFEGAELTTGTFKKGGRNGTRIVRKARQVRVHFTKSRVLRDMLKNYCQEEPMEKYGVDESVDQKKLEKQASEGCPNCGAKLAKHGNVLICPKCGSEPFEKESK